MRKILAQVLCLGLSSLMMFSALATAPDKIITVGPGKDFATIQAAIDTFQGTNALYTEIQISPGTYIENIQLEQTSASVNAQTRDYNLGEVIPTNQLLKGLQINGDLRPCFPQYQNGYQHAANSNQTTVYNLETDVAGVGPFQVLVSQDFGTQPRTNTGPLAVTRSNPFIADPLPLNGPFNGNLVIIGRGVIGFATKTKRAQDAGAGAVLIVNNQPFGVVALGGTDPTITIPAFSISQAQGNLLLLALQQNPGMKITIKPPATFYNPPIGSNFAYVSLSHPGGDFTKIQVTMNNPLPQVDPNLPRGTAPILEQPFFNDPRLAFVPGDKIILSESDIFGSGGRTVFEIASLNGNIITLTTAVDPADVDITKVGSSLTFLPNVLVKPSQGRRPVFAAQNIGFSMNGIWIDTNPSIAFGATSTAVVLDGVQAVLANIIVTDTNFTSANGFAFDLIHSDVDIEDGWRSSSANRRLSSIGWTEGFSINGMSRLGGPLAFVTNQTNGFSFNVTDNSFASIDSLIILGNPGLLQPGASGLAVTSDSTFFSANLLTVADIFGSGITGDASKLACSSFILERIYKPAGGLNSANALELRGDARFTVVGPDLYADDGSPTSLINNSSIVRDCFDIDPEGEFSSGTIPNIGINVDNEATFISEKELIFSHNSVDYLTVQDNQFIAPVWSQSPGNVFLVTQSGELNPVFQFQELVGSKIQLSLDPSKEFQFQGVYINSQNPGKTFTIFSKNPTHHKITLTTGSFVGSKRRTLKFCPIAGAFVTLKILSPTEVLILDSKGVFFPEKKKGDENSSSKSDRKEHHNKKHRLFKNKCKKVT
jgi:hypothetical protein